MNKKLLPLLILIFLTLTACTPPTPSETNPSTSSETTNPTASSSAGDTASPSDEAVTRPAGWAEESHSNDAAPNYAIVFPQDKVNQITITIDPADWEAMQADMTELLGEQGAGQTGPGGFGGPGGGQPPEGFDPAQGGGGFPGGGAPGFGGGDFTSVNPMWVAATIEFNGNTWTNVGVRYKGNSSLQSAWREGSDKLPLKLDFDEFEDDYPEIENQRFYGFKQLSLANGFGDATFMRDTITYDLLEDAGLVAAETAAYEVILDYGEGPVSLGLYTMIEVVDDTVIDRTFGDDSGNIYEGDGPAASFAEGTFDQIADSFQKENNDGTGWSDLETLYNILHSDQRTTDPEAWRASLEAIFDVDTFLEWLALSATLQHWDTYGNMTHNYYLYNNPATGQLTWISWDHNLVLGGSGGPGGGGFPGGGNNAGGDGGRGGPSRTVTFDKTEVGENWPLIRYLLDDPVYNAQYLSALEETVPLFNADALAAKYQSLATLLAPYVEDEAAFNTAVEQLTEQTYAQAEALEAFLAGE
ncbi:MAG: CotH kinase family protein [Anaerolineales bacterium]|nr:CotH kinase family protein [Anaerolineales bacterium]